MMCGGLNPPQSGPANHDKENGPGQWEEERRQELDFHGALSGQLGHDKKQKG
jgi:hypothetical protein